MIMNIRFKNVTYCNLLLAFYCYVNVSINLRNLHILISSARDLYKCLNNVLVKLQ